MTNEIIALLMKKMNVKENQIFHIVGEGNIFGQREIQYFFKDNCLYRKTMFGNEKSFEILGRLIEQEYPIIVMKETKELIFDAEQARQIAMPREKQLKQECIDVTTKNFINKTYKHIYCTGYADLHYLLKAYDAVFYNAGVCGWNWDAYEVDYNTVIITGYRNFTGYTIPWETACKYDDQARNLHRNSIDWNETKKQLHQLMQELLQELKK